MQQMKEILEQAGTRTYFNSQLWHACAGPLVSLPQMDSLVYYFPQGHSEQVDVTTKRADTSRIPRYPNLPSQLMCQVNSVMLNADRETDEVYAQITLRPVTSEKDVFPVPKYGFRPEKHPREFFCKALTASDTSTHGGFSVPRRAAEKLFPLLDYTAQPPTQDIVVRDLHDNTWNFRHIYRGQPKRHLLTTGWSLFIGSKRLRTGDSVLFMRDEKSQLLVGIRRANWQQTPMPSSVLSTDSMYIGILAAAAHAATHRSSFSVIYNPRACPAFVIPLAKYRKAVHGTWISAGMRFGMMFETEESVKRRYMGTVIGISDLDPLRWPGSKWRNLQVEWDGPGCGDTPQRISPWEIETPESLLIFPPLTFGLKRPYLPRLNGGETEWTNLIERPLDTTPEIAKRSLTLCPSIQTPCSEQPLRMQPRPQLLHAGVPGSSIPEAAYQIPLAAQFAGKPPLCISSSSQRCPQLLDTKCVSAEVQVLGTGPSSANPENQLPLTLDTAREHLNPSTILAPTACEDNMAVEQFGQTNQTIPSVVESTFHPQPCLLPPSDSSPFLNMEEYQLYSSSLQPLSTFVNSQCPPSIFGLQDSPAVFTDPLDHIPPSFDQDVWDHPGNDTTNLRAMLQPDMVAALPNYDTIFSNISLSGNIGSSVSGVLDERCTSSDTSLFNTPDYMVGNIVSSQDLQSQVSSVSLADRSGGMCSSSSSSSMLRKSTSGPPPPPPPPPAPPRTRTYTKVLMTGSVSRSIDTTNFRNYNQLLTALESMFGLAGLLSNPTGSGWILVYGDLEDDVLLIGDEPWEVFVSRVSWIRILSPVEVKQMSEEGMKLLRAAAGHGLGP